MAGRIYLIGKDGGLETLNERPYPQEDRLQMLLADHPDLLAGDQINEAEPRRWLLVSREVTVPLQEEGGIPMSLDHLFLDQDAIPTLVEVKRSNDTRIRREVVGQMLDYAANAVAYWTVEGIRARFEAALDEQSEDASARVAELIESDPNDVEAVEEYWSRVKTNLQAGRIRLIFVADEIPPELRRVVEFLNRSMDSVEVLAVEIRQFVGSGVRTLVPRVIGQTAQTQARKSGRGTSGRQWNEESFFAELTNRQSIEDARVAREILNWSKEHARITWGKGSRSGSFVPVIEAEGDQYLPFAVWTYGKVEIYFYWYQYKAMFKSPKSRLEILSRLNSIEGISLPVNAIDRRPSIPLSKLQDDRVLKQFLGVFDTMLAQIHGQ